MFQHLLRRTNLILAALPLSLSISCAVEGYGDSGSGSSAGPDASSATCTPATAAATVIAPNCGSCHGAAAPAAGLDLASPGLGDRIAGLASSTCADHIVVVAGDPAGSFLMEKLGAAPSCGDPMPKGLPSLSAEELACIEGWISGLQSSGGGGGDTGGDTGGGGGGGGGW